MRLAIVGKGMMGSLIGELARNRMKKDDHITSVELIEPLEGETLFSLEEPDVIIDFSHPDAFADVYTYLEAKKGKVGAVFGTTGFSKSQLESIKALGETTPVVQSYNYSYGIYALKKILGCAIPVLKERSDIEIIEKHHNRKADAPSGTALTLAEICDPNHELSWICGREGESMRQDELGLHSIRGGTFTGEHRVIFAMEDEVVEISHTAFSKRNFAEGALDAALWLVHQKPGIYRIEDVFY